MQNILNAITKSNADLRKDISKINARLKKLEAKNTVNKKVTTSVGKKEEKKQEIVASSSTSEQKPILSDAPATQQISMAIGQPGHTPVVDLKPETIGFFDPYFIDNTAGPVTSLSKHEIYRDIYIFVDRLKDLVNTRPYTYTIVKNMIPQCLKNSAKMWYTAELSDYKRDELRRGSLDE